ncbi:MAG TPA: outer membrane beta-barrel protein [Candidatus Binataceae bacterium]|nr:outer membrane beta-barrel protein [Candidatus Binataceae bacterium]
MLADRPLNIEGERSVFNKRVVFACASLLTMFLGLSASASAQEESTPRYEVGLNYSWLHVNSANYDYQRTGNGGSGYFLYNLTPMVGLVGDFGGYANMRTAINDKALTYLFGPRFTWRHSRWNPYAQFLFGGAYAWSGPNGNSNTQNAFAMASGGGLDYVLTQHIAIKPIQVEYVMTQFDSANLGGSTRGFGNHQNDVRYSAGVVFRLGEK